MAKKKAEEWISDLRGQKKEITSSRIMDVGEGVFQVEAGIGRRGVAIWVDGPKMARFLAMMLERAAEHLDARNS